MTGIVEMMAPTNTSTSLSVMLSFSMGGGEEQSALERASAVSNDFPDIPRYVRDVISRVQSVTRFSRYLKFPGVFVR